MDKENVNQYAIENMDLSYLKEIELRDGDERHELANIDVDSEIEELQREMSYLVIEDIPFDKWDYIMAFSLGLLEVAGDFLISDHNQTNSIANQMSDPNTELGKAFKDIHKYLDHAGQPLDYQGKGFGGGDHRGRTFAHDILMFPLALYMLKSGKFVDGYFDNGIFSKVITAFNQNGNQYIALSNEEAIIAYFTHMIADFFSAKSLPIPGFSLLTHFPNRDIRKFACELYKDGLNIRNLVMQGVPVATVEAIMWIWLSLRYKDSEYSKEQIKTKREILLLLSHSIATTVNINKVIITQNPTSLNLPMIIRTVHLSWKAIKREVEINHNTIERLEMGNVKNELETAKTLILLDDAIYYTNQIDMLIVDKKNEFDNINQRRKTNITNSVNELSNMLSELKELNDEGAAK